MTANEDDPTLLLVDDDPILCQVLSIALERRGFKVAVAHSSDEARDVLRENSPEYAVIDLKLPDGSGLSLVKTVKEADPHTQVVVLTGYASIATAVEAIKLGAINYLCKPANADAVVAAFRGGNGAAVNEDTPVADSPMSVNRLEWEYINRVLSEHDGNISATARALGMHRRTLQRKLAKRPVRK